MKRFDKLTISQVKEEILYWEQDNENPKSIEVISVGQNPDADIYKQGDGSMCERFFAVVVIDGEKYMKGYEWDCDDEDITASWDDDVTSFFGADSNSEFSTSES